MDKSFELYRNFTALYASDIKLGQIFHKIGIDEIYLYGMGEFGKQVACCLKDTRIIKGISDKKIKETKSIDNSILGEIIEYRLDEIPDDDILIVVSIANNFCDIRNTLIRNGVKAKRIVSLNALLLFSVYALCDNTKYNINNGSNEFLIVGSNFVNKGSQAMTFVVINEIRKKYKDAIIWMCPNYWDDVYKNNNYKVIILKDGYERGSTVEEILPRMTAVFDVSGYAISSNKGFGNTDRVMNYIKRAYDYDVPFFLLPQSFGPIEYPRYKMAEMGELFKSCRMIFAREQVGYELLRKAFKLENLKISNDMVLQSETLDENNIYLNSSENKINVVVPKDSVAIIPNRNLLLYMSEYELVKLYEVIICDLVSKGLNIYILNHSDDNNICEKIYECFDETDNVNYLNVDFDCIQFSSLIYQFKFTIASRYHSIIHAYKMGVPCVIIGWADKYVEIGQQLGQVDYIIDVRDKKDYLEKINRCVNGMIKNCDRIRLTLQAKIFEIQKDSCFNYVWDELN